MMQAWLRGQQISRPLNTSCGDTWRIWSIGRNHGQRNLAANYGARWSHEKKHLNYLEGNKFSMNRTQLCKEKCGSHFEQQSVCNTTENWRSFVLYDWICLFFFIPCCNVTTLTNITNDDCICTVHVVRSLNLLTPTHAQLNFTKNHLKNSYMFRSTTIFRELQYPR